MKPHRFASGPSSRRILGLTAIVAASLPVVGAAQWATSWTNDASKNTVLSNNGYLGAETHTIVRSDGGALYAYVQLGTQYLVIQRLDTLGIRQLPVVNGGGVVIDQNPTWTVYGVPTGTANMAIAYRTTDHQIWARIVDATGSATSAVKISTLSAPGSGYFAITTDGSGGSFIAWLEKGTVNASIHVKHMLNNGTIDTSSSWLPTGATITTAPLVESLSSIQVASDATGGAFVGWLHTSSASTFPMTRRVLADGTFAFNPLLVEELVHPVRARALEMVSDDAGNAFFATHHRTDSSSTYQLVSQRVDLNGARAWPLGSSFKTGIVTFDQATIRGWDDFALAADGTGGMVVIMTHEGFGFDNMPLMGQRVNGDTLPHLKWGELAMPKIVSTHTANFHFANMHPKVIVNHELGAATVFVTWAATTTTKGGPFDIHAQRLNMKYGNKTWGSNQDLVVTNADGNQYAPLIAGFSNCSWVVAFRDERVPNKPAGACQLIRSTSTGPELGSGPCNFLISPFVANGTKPLSHNVVLTPLGLVAVSNGNNGTEVYIISSSGKATLLADIYPGSGGSNPSNLTSVGGMAFFSANDGTNGVELWCTDGSAAGTRLVKDIGSGSLSSTPLELTAVGSVLYFTADDGTKGRELYRTDGTAAGTVQVADINPGAGSSSPGELFGHGNTLFFAATTPNAGRELFRTDSAAGVLLVRDLSSGPTSSDPGFLTTMGDLVYFTATGPAGTEIYRTDGSVVGTIMVKDIVPGIGSSSPEWLTVVDHDWMFFSANTSLGYELWKTDGSAAGTTLVKDINPGSGGSYPQMLTAVPGGVLFAAAGDSNNDRELWKSDGSAAGTKLVKDIRAGPASSSPQHLSGAGSRRVYFRADDGSTGPELFATDGDRVELVEDLRPGSQGSNPSRIALRNGELTFFANDGTGTQFFMMKVGATSEPLGCGCAGAATSEPKLGATDPTLGGRSILTGRNEPIGTVAVLLGGVPSQQGIDVLGCRLYMSGVVAPMILLVRLVTSSQSSLSLPIPAAPALHNFKLLVQDFYVPMAGKWSASNGVLLNLGH